MTAPNQDYTVPRNAEKSSRARHPQASLSPLPGNSVRGMLLPRSLWSSTKVGTLEIQRVLPKKGRGPRLALVWGWPTPIRMNARTELPPLPRKPVYGPAARDEVRRIMRGAKREGINFGWFTRMNLYRVIKGERPLSYSVWERAQAYMKRVRRERKHEQDVRERPLQVRFVAGKGLLLGWRQGSPPRGMKPQTPKGTQDPSAERQSARQGGRRSPRREAPGPLT